MGQGDQEVWECRSRLARSLIARRCAFSFGIGLLSWLQLLVFCFMCMLGRWGSYTTIFRWGQKWHVCHTCECGCDQAFGQCKCKPIRLLEQSVSVVPRSRFCWPTICRVGSFQVYHGTFSSTGLLASVRGAMNPFFAELITDSGLVRFPYMGQMFLLHK